MVELSVWMCQINAFLFVVLSLHGAHHILHLLRFAIHSAAMIIGKDVDNRVGVVEDNFADLRILELGKDCQRASLTLQGNSD